MEYRNAMSSMASRTAAAGPARLLSTAAGQRPPGPRLPPPHPHRLAEIPSPGAAPLPRGRVAEKCGRGCCVRRWVVVVVVGRWRRTGIEVPLMLVLVPYPLVERHTLGRPPARRRTGLVDCSSTLVANLSRSAAG